MNKRRRGFRGFTLLEILLAITIFGLSIPTVGIIFANSLKEEVNTTFETQAAFLASAMMDEISQRRFQESAALPGNGIDGGEESAFVRSDFDDIDDYDIYSQTWGSENPPRDENGNALNNYSALTRTVDIYNVSDPTLGPSGRDNYDTQTDGATNYKVVKVVVTWDQGKRNVTLYKVFSKP